ncbi:chalcone isomerase family protein [Vibrio sp. Isolate23]|uniref:chalcone isomerase family protein n=1 Tax=Vibrio sp. Isolate23 TaxID=2908533 RepID=UPI001EFED6F2|nr:chalcone isomerase family protein [Vibrio sp. Isolate23]MCG9682686.1 chalcone isomerase family protein [Vibrio sp. Isolate23]
MEIRQIKWVTLAGLIASSLTISTSIKADAVSDKNWQEWRQVGSAQLTYFFFDIYRSQLLTPTGNYTQSRDISPHPLALSIEYQRDISQKQLVNATREQWEKLGYSDTGPWVTQLEKIFPDIKDGQQLTYVSDGDKGRFYFSSHQEKNQWIGSITDPKLNDAFLAIWLSPQTQYPKLRQDLIGAK